MQELLNHIVRQLDLEACWLNTLSLLEFIGARKISKTVCQSHPSLEILEHYSDETRHARVFKELSLRISRGNCEDYLCRDEAIHYFQTLDRRLSEWIQKLTRTNDPYQNYLLVTAIIERRAMKLYPVYRKTTYHAAIRDELKRIVDEEARHRRIIEDKCLKILNHNDVPDFEECENIETELFQEFTNSLQKEIFS